MTNYEWGPAEVTYPDWQGTFQIDQRITGPDDVYSLSGIDSEEWTIIGLDWGAGEHEYGWHDLHVIAVPKGKDYSGPEVEATDFLIHNVNPIEFLAKITHVADFRVRSRVAVNSRITITELRDVPEQP